MNPVLFTLFIVTKAVAAVGMVALILLWLLITAIFKRPWREYRRTGDREAWRYDWGELNPKIVPLLPLLALLCSVWYFATESIGAKTFIRNRDGKITSVFQERTILWAWEYFRLKGGGEVLSHAPRRASAEVQVSPLTSNPKVRHTRVSATAETIATPEDSLSFSKAVGVYPSRFPYLCDGEDDVKFITFLSSALYEFSEERSKEIGEFYNPLDREQQARFQALVKDFLDPRLKEAGTQIVQARFSF